MTHKNMGRKEELPSVYSGPERTVPSGPSPPDHNRRQMQHSEGVDEMRKAQDQMLWVGRMNSIQQRAEEIVVDELIFS